MKILFIGNFSTPWSTNHPMAIELKKRNYDVINFDFRGIAQKNIKIKSPLYTKKFYLYFDSFIRHRLYLPNSIKRIKYYIFGNYKMNKKLLSIVNNNRFDLIFLAKTDTVDYKSISKFKNSAKVWYYFMDPLNIALQMNAHKYASLADWCSASTMVMNQFFKDYGANSYYITQGFDSNLFKPGKENKNKKIDVIFIGQTSNKRKRYIDYLLKNNIKVVCYGKGWSNEPIYLEKLVKKYRQSKIILNFLRLETGFSIRIFQAMGTGSLLLSEYCPDLVKTFKKGVHLDWFKTPEECLTMIKQYLENETKREKIAREGYNFVYNNYSWGKIMDKIIHIIQND